MDQRQLSSLAPQQLEAPTDCSQSAARGWRMGRYLAGKLNQLQRFEQRGATERIWRRNVFRISAELRDSEQHRRTGWRRLQLHDYWLCADWEHWRRLLCLFGDGRPAAKLHGNGQSLWGDAGRFRR